MTLQTEAVIMQDRYRLLVTRGRGAPSIYRYGAQAARSAAESMFAETGVPVMILFAPPDGLVRTICTVGDEPAKGRKR